jgi:outer membrane protein OmpA-like peptidoglycan-associated protein
MLRRVVIVPVLVAALLLPLGCATKKFVRGEMQKRDAQIGRIDADLGQERTRIGELGPQVVDVRTRADEATRRADQATGMSHQAVGRADEASSKAGQAIARAEETDNRLTKLWNNRNKRSIAETVLVRFGFDKADLDDRAQTALAELAKQLRDNPNVLVTLEGYTDKSGPASYNVQLSQRRAEAVRRFMVQHGVDVHRIQSIGLGIVPENTKGSRQEHRTVAVTLSVPAAD